MSTVYPLTREAPNAVDAEQALLGALLINNAAVEDAGDLDGRHFHEPLHGAIFDLIARMHAAGKVASPITMRPHFATMPALDGDVPVHAYLARLAARAPSLINVKDYARTIREVSIRRALILIGEDIVNGAYDAASGEDARALVDQAEQRLFQLTDRGAAASVSTLAQALDKALKRASEAYQAKGQLLGLSTGYPDIDAVLGGMEPSDLIILAGRPAMGKTALATNITVKVAMQRHAVHVFSLEMSDEQLASRILADQSDVSASDLRRGSFTEEVYRKLAMEAGCASEFPVLIDDTGGLTIAQMMTRARRAKRQHDTKLIVIDYLQLMRSGRRDGNRTQEITEITNGLKMMAKEMSVPVLALSQLSRDVEKRSDKRPQLSDLRESGSIEQDADMVLFVYRDDYYLNREEPEMGTDEHLAWQQRCAASEGTAEVIVAKNRHGPTATVRLAFQPHLTRFSSLTTQEAARV